MHVLYLLQAVNDVRTSGQVGVAHYLYFGCNGVCFRTGESDSLLKRHAEVRLKQEVHENGSVGSKFFWIYM